jgi:hypothetical protein
MKTKLMLILTVFLMACSTAEQLKTVNKLPEKPAQSFTQTVIYNTVGDYKVEDGVVYLTNEQVTNNGINIVSEWCSRTGICNFIHIPFDRHDVKYNIALHPNTSLTATKGTVINMYPSNPDTAAVYFTRGRRTYADNIGLHNIEFKLQSKAIAVIQTNSSVKIDVINCIVNANSLALNGIVIDGEPIAGSINTLIQKTEVREAMEAGILLSETGASHFLNRVQVRKNGIGVSGYSNQLVITNSQIEGNDVNLSLKGGRGASVSNSTFERGDLFISDMDRFIFNFNKVSGGNFEFNKVPYTELTNNILNGCKIIGTDRVKVEGNMWQTIHYDEFLKSNCDSLNTIKDNFNSRDGHLTECK